MDTRKEGPMYKGRKRHFIHIIAHMIESIQKQRRCGECGKKVQRQCRKCAVPLHVDCFAKFHCRWNILVLVCVH